MIHFYDSEESFYYLSIVDVLLVGLPAAVFMLGAGHFVGKLLRGKVAVLIQRTSADLNRIYLIYWVFVMWIVDVLVHRACNIQMSTFALLIVSFVVLAVSAIIVRHRPFSKFKL